MSQLRVIFASLFFFALATGARAQDSTGQNPAALPTGQGLPILFGRGQAEPWSFQQLIVGTTSTGSLATGGNPIYQPTMPTQSGIASLIISKSGVGTFGCSGSLLDDRRSILTAAHCIADGSGNLNAYAATAYFYAGSSSSPYNPDTIVPGNPLATAITVSNFYVAPGYSGKTIEDDDLAVLRLSSPAPSFAQGYDVFTGNPSAFEFTVAGYGFRSNGGGSTGFSSSVGSGILRQGLNRFDLQWGDPNFNGYFASAADFSSGLNTWVADFDSGSAANDSNCLVAVAVNPSLAGNGLYCQTGQGAREAMPAPGDSGGPGFIDGRIATVTSYIGSLGQTFGDIDAVTNGTFGEIAGFVPVSRHLAFIQSVKVPAPLSVAVIPSLMAWSRQLRRRIHRRGRPSPSSRS